MTAVTLGSDMLVSEWIPYDEDAVKSVTDILEDWDGLKYLKITLRADGGECYLNPSCVQYVTIERRNTDTVEDVAEKAPTFRDLVAGPRFGSDDYSRTPSYRGRGG